MRWALFVALLCCALAQAADPKRDPAVRAEFMRTHPCPATGLTTGACPGWQVDHREALICGGADVVGNLQWLTVEDHKAKTRAEVKLCRPRASVVRIPE